MIRGKLRGSTGNWVTGEYFWDREVEMELLRESLRDESHLLLTAPRRIGKTSLLKEASLQLVDEFLCLYVDLEKAESPAEAIVEFGLAARQYEPTWRHLTALFRHTFRENIETIKYQELSVTLRSGLTAENWRAKGDGIFEILAEQDRPVALFLDEVAILVNRLLRGGDYVITDERRAEVDIFLSWLRANGIRHQRKVRIVVTGSIGLEPLVRQAGLSATLNTFTPFHLGPWNRPIAGGCLDALASNYGLSLVAEAREQMLDLLGVLIPHHVQMFFNHVYQSAKLQGLDTISIGLVRAVYQETMLGVRGHVELSHMEERLKAIIGPGLSDFALDLLTEAAVVGAVGADTCRELATRHLASGASVGLQSVLDLLEHDGYLIKAGNNYTFVPGLLRDWWIARFRFAYVPIAQRK